MRPVGRVRPSSASRAAAAGADASAAALRDRFQQLLREGAAELGARAPAVAQDAAAQSAGPSVWGCGAVFEHIANRPEGLAVRRGGTPAQDEDAAQMLAPIAGAGAGGAYGAEDHNAPRLGLWGLRAGQPSASTEVLAPLFDGLPPRACLDAALWGQALHSATAPVGDKDALPSCQADSVAASPPVATWQGGSALAQSPAAPSLAPAKGQSKDLPELVRELVQAVVHLARGREGSWRLVMALKQEVLDGALLEVSAQPGKLQVRFECSSANAFARLSAARADLHQRLAEVLCSKRPVDVQVDVQTNVQAVSHGTV
jgi:Type III secretion protein (HpaP)